MALEWPVIKILSLYFSELYDRYSMWSICDVTQYGADKSRKSRLCIEAYKIGLKDQF